MNKDQWINSMLYLSLDDIKHLSETSKEFRDIYNDDMLWHQLVLKDYPLWTKFVQNNKWKELYQKIWSIYKIIDDVNNKYIDFMESYVGTDSDGFQIFDMDVMTGKNLDIVWLRKYFPEEGKKRDMLEKKLESIVSKYGWIIGKNSNEKIELLRK